MHISMYNGHTAFSISYLCLSTPWLRLVVLKEATTTRRKSWNDVTTTTAAMKLIQQWKQSNESTKKSVSFWQQQQQPRWKHKIRNFDFLKREVGSDRIFLFFFFCTRWLQLEDIVFAITFSFTFLPKIFVKFHFYSISNNILRTLLIIFTCHDNKTC